MKKKILLLIILLITALLLVVGCNKKEEVKETENRTVVDMAGRSVEIPANVEKIYATGTLGTILIQTLAPESIAGLNSEMSEMELKYLGDTNKATPVLGSWKGTQYNGNIEEFLMVKPDVIINMGDVSEAYISDTEEIEKQTGIPVLMVDGSIDKTAEAYTFLGEILNKEDRAKKLSDYFTKTMSNVKGVINNIPEEKRVKVYYAMGPKGLETELRGTINSEIIEIAGGLNVASSNWKSESRRIQVSLEQVILENPDVVIISIDGDSNHQVYKDITNSSSWGVINAVNDGKVYEIPGIPYDWINRPPSVNRIIGIKWLANILYPDKYEIDVKQEIKDFFELYYLYDITDEEIEEILVNSKVN
ncbi:ABC transporter substrate-binding protein [Sedimentibacter sp. MB31-C6]|uniref:ABC transporter substrate-binding protein n=1 Tax=Sedimentibacter sp. MB31-C6 TaxID=3109366 RepID=UPI002DDD106D|nr:ABC transporter substrate-binding protein [Sedimentibacter sp. MB36-C1]WSI04453.1 ABC transporter substrate-binding protein [Sedimentibacter sp. MB36-C1]